MLSSMLGGVPCRVCHSIFRTNVMPLRFKGHNKWSNIRHVKAANDMLKSKNNSLMMSRMREAIRSRGGDNNPETNSSLRKVIMNAKAMDVPKALIQKTLKGSSDSDMTELVFEVKSIGGVSLVVECLAKSRAQVSSDLGPILKKRGGSFDKGNSVLPMFEKKGVIIAEPKGDLDSEASLEDAIEAGAEEVNVLDEESKVLEFITGPLDLMQVKESLEEKNYSCSNVAINYIPKFPVSPGALELASTNKLIEALEENALVVAVHPNF